MLFYWARVCLSNVGVSIWFTNKKHICRSLKPTTLINTIITPHLNEPSKIDSWTICRLNEKKRKTLYENVSNDVMWSLVLR